MRLRRLLRRLKTDVLGWSRLAAAAALCFAIIAVTAYAAYAAVWPAVAGHSYFRLRSVKVTCDSERVVPAELASRAGLYEGTSVWEVDVDGAQAALSEAAWVRSARVTRRFPGHVSLEVYRREPLAATVGADGPYLIDRDGVVYREEEHVEYADLPYLTGWQEAPSRSVRVERLRIAMALAAAARKYEVDVSEIHTDLEGTYWLYPEAPRVSVRLGTRPDAERVMPRIRAVLRTLPESAEDVRELDLSYEDRAVLRVASGRVKRVLAVLASRTTKKPARNEDRG